MNCTACGNRRIRTGSSRTIVVDDAPRGSDLCNFCYTEASWENEHDDYDHDADNMDDACWICHPELNLARQEKRTGHTNTATKAAHRSHAACGHPRTPKGRAACRKAGGPKA